MIELQKIEPDANNYEHTGKSNAKESDIKIIHKQTLRKSYAECKKGNSLAGEIQLKINHDTKTFEYLEKSLKDGSDPNISPYAIQAVKYLNDNNLYDTLVCAGKSRIDFDLDSKFCENCVKSIYKDKQVLFFFIYKNGKYVVFPLDKLDKYLKISVRFRFHPSGTTRHFKTTDFKDYFDQHGYAYTIKSTIHDYKNGGVSKHNLTYIETSVHLPEIFLYKHEKHKYSFRFEKCDSNLWIVTMVPPEDKTYPCLEFKTEVISIDQDQNDFDNVKYFLKNAEYPS